jgi:tRNA A37 methylthiotransferase MiaB
MQNQIPKTEKERRSVKMLELAKNMKREFYQNYIGEVVDVLFEARKKASWHGLTANYMDVLVAGANSVRPLDLEGKIKKVKITNIDGEFLTGEIIE